MEQSRDVLTLPCQDPRSFHGNLLSITSLWAERTRRCGGNLETAGSARLETCYTLPLAVGACCPQSPCKHQSSDSGFTQPPHRAEGEPGRKSTHILCGCEQPSKRKVFCLFPRSKLVCRKSVSQTLTSHTSLFSFPNIFLHLLVTGSLKISKCFMQKGNLLFSMLFVSNRLLFIVNFWFILWQHEALNGK